jgi:hypothetical protein
MPSPIFLVHAKTPLMPNHSVPKQTISLQLLTLCQSKKKHTDRFIEGGGGNACLIKIIFSDEKIKIN